MKNYQYFFSWSTRPAFFGSEKRQVVGKRLDSQGNERLVFGGVPVAPVPASRRCDLPVSPISEELVELLPKKVEPELPVVPDDLSSIGLSVFPTKQEKWSAPHIAARNLSVARSAEPNGAARLVDVDRLQESGLQVVRDDKKPPYCNTGGYGFQKKNSKKKPVNVTKIDWLRATVQDVESFMHTLGDLEGILKSANIEIFWTDKGLHGYDKSAKLFIRNDGEVMTMGNIAMAEGGRNQGGMVELTGKGCNWLQLNYPKLWIELHDLFVCFEWRFSRCDIALDLPGQYCLDNGLTVPSLFKRAVHSGLFRSEKLRNPNMKQTFSMAGDWSELVVSGVTPENYDPLVDCPAGLTAYVGSRKGSADFFRVYEKGKELLGAQAEPESIDRAWVRVEHEMSRKGTGREMPLDIMLRPDNYFALDRPAARQLMNDLRESLEVADAYQVHLNNYNKEKGLSLEKKVHWARYSYGRLFKTLVDKGHEYDEIIGWLSREEGLKEFIDDMAEAA